MFKRPFSFKGRIDRGEFLTSTIILYIAGNYIEQNLENLDKYFVVIIAVIHLWFALAQGAKRAHDCGHNGFYMLIPFYQLWLLFAPGEYSKNQYNLDKPTLTSHISDPLGIKRME